MYSDEKIKCVDLTVQNELNINRKRGVQLTSFLSGRCCRSRATVSNEERCDLVGTARFGYCGKMVSMASEMK